MESSVCTILKEMHTAQISYPSLQAPFHSFRPHGFLSFTISRFSLWKRELKPECRATWQKECEQTSHTLDTLTHTHTHAHTHTYTHTRTRTRTRTCTRTRTHTRTTHTCTNAHMLLQTCTPNMTASKHDSMSPEKVNAVLSTNVLVILK